jgi:hypothetical protein
MMRDAFFPPQDSTRAWIRLDRVGTTSAVLCAIHCAALPVLAIIAPLVPLGVAQSEALEWTFVIVGLLLGVSSLVPSFTRGHRRLPPLAFFAVGMIALLVARLVLDGHAQLETPVAVAGALLMAIAHVVNRKIGGRSRNAAGLCHTNT